MRPFAFCSVVDPVRPASWAGLDRGWLVAWIRVLNFRYYSMSRYQIHLPLQLLPTTLIFASSFRSPHWPSCLLRLFMAWLELRDSPILTIDFCSIISSVARVTDQLATLMLKQRVKGTVKKRSEIMRCRAKVFISLTLTAPIKTANNENDGELIREFDMSLVSVGPVWMFLTSNFINKCFMASSILTSNYNTCGAYEAMLSCIRGVYYFYSEQWEIINVAMRHPIVLVFRHLVSCSVSQRFGTVSVTKLLATSYLKLHPAGECLLGGYAQLPNCCVPLVTCGIQSSGRFYNA